MNINIVCGVGVGVIPYVQSSPVPSWRHQHLEISPGVFCPSRSGNHIAKPGMFTLVHRNSGPEAPCSVKVTSKQIRLQKVATVRLSGLWGFGRGLCDWWQHLLVQTLCR